MTFTYMKSSLEKKKVIIVLRKKHNSLENKTQDSKSELNLDLLRVFAPFEKSVRVCRLQMKIYYSHQLTSIITPS